MAPTEVRVAKPERRWGCRRGTPPWPWSWPWPLCFEQKINRNWKIAE